MENIVTIEKTSEGTIYKTIDGREFRVVQKSKSSFIIESKEYHIKWERRSFFGDSNPVRTDIYYWAQVNENFVPYYIIDSSAKKYNSLEEAIQHIEDYKIYPIYH